MTAPDGPPRPVRRREAIAEIEHVIADIMRTVAPFNREMGRRFGCGLTLPLYATLRDIAFHGPLRAGDLVLAFEIDLSSVSCQVSFLRKEGLIESTVDPDHRRSELLVASPSALKEFQRTRSEASSGYEMLFERRPDADVERLAQLMDRLNARRRERER